MQLEPRIAPQKYVLFGGELLVRELEDSPQRVAAYAGWLSIFKTWSRADRSAKEHLAKRAQGFPDS